VFATRIRQGIAQNSEHFVIAGKQETIEKNRLILEKGI